ncbi:Lon protease family protein [Desulfohalobium retbaense]|uniref:endopeptidase La n=1 Tax=Desulfohalobium retbaense (strain ATCC 49708 / DSM 5692 / JCM 16813 / HR100) TaxID=485915 RepID=C8X117_DESRD|nr:ATP-binding protein [Desulfohalobium retbaense]ACV68114.1 peptidase S16 lon domain protein [Desulfohalobium retbaense DSM 5692]
MQIKPLQADEVSCPCTKAHFAFASTEEVLPLNEKGHALGQPRAQAALEFGTHIRRHGYNIFAHGAPGSGRHSLVRQMLRQQAATEEVGHDWCYVNNFDDQTSPAALCLPPGLGRSLAEDMDRLIDEVRNALKSAFESEEYQNRMQSLEQELKDKQNTIIQELQEKAQEKGLRLIRTPSGLAFAAVRDGEVLPREEFQKLSEEERKKIEQDIQELQQESHRQFQKLPGYERRVREKMRSLSREMADYAIGTLLEEMREKYGHLDDVLEHINAVQKDIVDSVPRILNPEGDDQQGDQFWSERQESMTSPAVRRYRINVLVDRSDHANAPVVYEDNPSLSNLLGRVEHQSQMGTLVTDFNLIRAGALHRANGGYLILDAEKLLTHPGAWEALKRALQSSEIKLESLAQMYSLISTVSLEPQPVPLDVKVVLVGSPFVHALLQYYDPEFDTLFKVAADFAPDMDRTANQEGFARLVSGFVHKHSLHHFTASGVARLFEYSLRLAGDREKLSANVRQLEDMAVEADYFAGQKGEALVRSEEVQRAIDERQFRSDRIRERLQEEIFRETLLIATQGSQAGQINGLSVYQVGGLSFGRPSRITARIRLGRGEVVDIERESKLSGPLHSKGVLILTGFLSGRFGVHQPLSLSASLVFEQSYGGVDGDSASSAELYALLSAIAGVPLRQDLAVTGAVDQHGQIQAIGGVNEKIEGFYDICQQRGLTGQQGVLIPASNRKHLVLRGDVVEAVRQGGFSIYPIRTVDEGIELLTGMEAGSLDSQGNSPSGSFNALVMDRLKTLAARRQAFVASAPDDRGDGHGE